MEYRPNFGFLMIDLDTFRMDFLSFARGKSFFDRTRRGPSRKTYSRNRLQRHHRADQNCCYVRCFVISDDDPLAFIIRRIVILLF